MTRADPQVIQVYSVTDLVTDNCDWKPEERVGECNATALKAFRSKHHRRRKNYKADSLRLTPIRYATILKVVDVVQIGHDYTVKKDFLIKGFLGQDHSTTPRMYRHISRPIKKQGRCGKKDSMLMN